MSAPQPLTFPPLTPAARAEARPSVCIVTSELVGLFKNGGIGTSMTGLAETLAQAGFPVTALYTGPHSAPVEMETWRDRYAAKGIELTWLDKESLTSVGGPVGRAHFATPYLVYQRLCARHFDVLHFNDCLGEGFYCQAMKRLGRAFHDTLICLAMHSPSEWVFELNHTLPDHALYAAYSYAERLSTLCSDLVWSPSQYLTHWAREAGFEFPNGVFLQPYAIPVPALSSLPAPDEVVCPVSHIAFFGRLEERKGLRVFCQALRLLNDELAARGVRITFLGKPGLDSGFDALAYLRRESVIWRFEWVIEGDRDQTEAIELLRSSRALAVMASSADNSPCTVYEALTLGLPFLASRTGGIPELIAQHDQDRILFDYTPDALAQKLRLALDHGVAPSAPVHSQEALRSQWVDAFIGWRERLPELPEAAPARSLTVIIDHCAGQDLDGALEHVLALPNLARVLVIDRTGVAVARHALVEVTDIGAQGPKGVLAALKPDDSQALLLLRSGALVDTAAIADLLTALRQAEVDGLAPAARVKVGNEERIWPPLGASASFAFYKGAACTGALLIKMEQAAVLAQVARGLADVEFLGLADLAIIQGMRIWPYPDVVLHMNDDVEPVGLGSTSRARTYGQASARDQYYMRAIGLGHDRRRAAAPRPRQNLRARLLRSRPGRLVKRTLRWAEARLASALARRS